MNHIIISKFECFCSTMGEIKDTIKKHTQRGFLKRMVFNDNDSSVVKQCKDRLDSVLQLFGVEYFSISAQQLMSHHPL